MLEALPEPVVLHDQGTVLAANRAFLAMLGLTLDEAKRETAAARVHPDDRAEMAARMISTERRRRTPEHRILHKDGTAIPVEVTGIPFPYRGKMVALAIVHDLRERKRIEHELSASERMASLGRLASTVGHEINNPLTYVIGALELLARDITALGPARATPLLERIELAREGAARVRDIVSDLRALAAPVEPRPGVANVQRALDVAAASCAHEIEHRARLVRDHGELPAVAANEGRLVQVFVNLLINAAHAIDDGDVAGNEIRVVATAGEGRVAIEVLDTGRGFAPHEATQLFDPFLATPHGSGIGLSIAKRIVEAYGGTLVASARIPRGGCFRVELPASAHAATPAAAQPPSPTTRAAGRVLFADDEPMIRRLATPALDPFEVVTVASGREAIAVLERGEVFDAIVCDLQMPDLGGVDVFEWIAARRSELIPRTLFMTGGAFTERARQFLERTQRPYVMKPFTLEQLREAVERAINAVQQPL
jgi:PAS domain S-box-containing protein